MQNVLTKEQLLTALPRVSVRDSEEDHRVGVEGGCMDRLPDTCPTHVEA